MLAGFSLNLITCTLYPTRPLFPPRPNKKTENAVQPSSTPGGTGLGSATMAAEAAEEDGAKRPEPLELEGSVRENSFGIGSFTRTFSSKHHSPSHSLTRAFSKLARSPSQKEARLHSAREQQRSIRDVVEMREKERKRMARMLIDPRTSSFVNRWDVVTALALLFTATFTPFEISFLGTAGLKSFRFFLNRVIDAIFTFDLCLNFFVMFPQQKSVVESVYWVDDLKIIMLNYLKGWFTIDLISILPFWILDYTSGCASDMQSTNLLRLVRLMRCIKMIRLVRASRIVKRWQTKIPMSHATLSMTKCLVAITFFGHWFACVWTLQTSLFARSRLDTWLHQSSQQWCRPTPNFDESAPPEGCEDVELDPEAVYIDNGICDHPGEIYVASMYLAIVTITSVGYGDITATNVSETIVLTILMMCSALMWGLVIGTFSGIFSTMNPSETAFRNVMDELNYFMRNYGFQPDMQRRVREYFYQSRHLQLAKSHTALLEMMSPKLQGEVTLLCNEKWIRNVWFFKGCEEDFLIQVALSMTPAVYVPDETVPPGNLYVLHSGMVLYGGRVVASGESWGDDMLITRIDLQSRFSALALGYTNVFKISCSNLRRIAAPFPKVIKQLRFSAARLALRREFISLAKARVNAAASSKSSNSSSRSSNSSKQPLLRKSSSSSKPDIKYPHSASPSDFVDARVTKVEDRLESMDTKLDQVQAQLALLVQRLAPSSATVDENVPMVTATVAKSPTRQSSTTREQRI